MLGCPSVEDGHTEMFFDTGCKLICQEFTPIACEYLFDSIANIVTKISIVFASDSSIMHTVTYKMDGWYMME